MDEEGAGFGCDGPAAAAAMGSFLRVVDGEGASTNMMEGPGASSGATAVRGVGLEVNFGNDCWRIGGGRTASVLMGGTGLLDELS